jgi:hypothetical protein
VADRDFVVKTGLRTVGNTFVANSTIVALNSNTYIPSTPLITLTANGSIGGNAQILVANSSGKAYWKSVSSAANTLLNYTFSNTVTLSGNVVVNSFFYANGSVGNNGDALIYNGSNVYWSPVIAGVTFSGALTTTGNTANPGVSLSSLSPRPNGTFIAASITVDQYGRVTTAANGAPGGISSVASGNTQLITVSGSGTGPYNGAVTLTVVPTGIAAAAYNFASMAVDSVGRVVSVSNTFVSNASFGNNYLLSSALKSYSEYLSNVTVSTANTSLDLSTSNFFNLTLSSNTTLTFTNPPSGRVYSFTIVAKQDATGGRTLAWPSTKKYPNGQTPVSTTAANALDLWSVVTYDGGTSYIVSLSMKNVS